MGRAAPGGDRAASRPRCDARNPVDGEITATGAGALGKATGVEVTADSLFQIGSITKVWTATLVMQLADDRLLRLDAPVAEQLPGFAVADPEVTRSVTPRHLLTHTSGIDGDVFNDTGRGDDCLERYVAELSSVEQIHPLGATWSYCNSGFGVLGRLVEHLTGTTWDRALRDRLIEPLGLTHTVTLPEEVLLHRVAVGHVGDPDEDPCRRRPGASRARPGRQGSSARLSRTCSRSCASTSRAASPRTARVSFPRRASRR